MIRKATPSKFNNSHIHNNENFKFTISENIIYFLPSSDIFHSILKETIWYHNWENREITERNIAYIVWKKASNVQTISWFLVISTNDYFYIFNTDMEIVYKSIWNLLNIFYNHKWTEAFWLHIWIWKKEYLYSNIWWLINVTRKKWEIENNFVIMYKNSLCSCYNDQWNKIISKKVTIISSKRNYIIALNKKFKEWCYSVDWKFILPCKYDNINIYENFVVWEQWKIHTIYHINWKQILRWKYDKVIIQWWYIITQSYDKYNLYTCIWIKIYSWKKFMYMTDKFIIHTIKNNKRCETPLSSLIYQKQVLLLQN